MALRTLVISDLHLGSHGGRDVLRGVQEVQGVGGARGVRGGLPLQRLLDALEGYDRLVLLGDIVELRQGPVREALAAGEQALRAIGAALGPGREVVIVPGNHDHHLLSAWLERRARRRPPPPLGLEMAVERKAGETLATMARWLSPATVRSAYPGVWLRDDVYAMHGHYGDRHTTVPMLERLGVGAMARIVGEPAAGPLRAEDYEATLAPIYAWIHAVAQWRGGAEAGGSGQAGALAGAALAGPALEGPALEDPALGRPSAGVSAHAWQLLTGGDGRRSWRRRGMIAGFPMLIAVLNRAGLGPLRADLSGPELRRAALRGFGEAVWRLQVPANHVIFGHTHRAGPLAPDDRSEWQAPGGARLINSGCWVHEHAFLGPDPRTSPYRAGFAVSVPDHGPPELRCLLD